MQLCNDTTARDAAPTISYKFLMTSPMFFELLDQLGTAFPLRDHLFLLPWRYFLHICFFLALLNQSLHNIILHFHRVLTTFFLRTFKSSYHPWDQWRYGSSWKSFVYLSLKSIVHSHRHLLFDPCLLHYWPSRHCNSKCCLLINAALWFHACSFMTLWTCWGLY